MNAWMNEWHIRWMVATTGKGIIPVKDNLKLYLNISCFIQKSDSLLVFNPFGFRYFNELKTVLCMTCPNINYSLRWSFKRIKLEFWENTGWPIITLNWIYHGWQHPPGPILLLTTHKQVLVIGSNARLLMSPLSALMKTLEYYLIDSYISINSYLLKIMELLEEKSCLP